MRTVFGFRGVAILLVALMTSSAWADNYSGTIEVFKKAVPSVFFEKSYGYAVFPTIGKGQAFSQIIFFEDERAFTQFTSGNFEFGAQATAVAITAGASATATTTGNSAGASGGRNDAKSVGEYYRGMATFTVAKGGLMYEATIGGQKFNYKKVKPAD